jgi:hypothetical protein
MKISKEEAEQALRDIEVSKEAMRTLVRFHRGHLFLWLWGTVFIVVAALDWISSQRFWVPGNWIFGGAVVATVLIGWGQGRTIRSPIDKRFLAVCFTLLAFGYFVWPSFLGLPHSDKAAYGYGLLIWMQVYMVAGIWFRNYWLWMGVAVTVLLVAGYLLFPGAFWACCILGGATLVATGFYVRYGWR